MLEKLVSQESGTKDDSAFLFIYSFDLFIIISFMNVIYLLYFFTGFPSSISEENLP